MHLTKSATMIYRILFLLSIVICPTQITYSQTKNEEVASTWLQENFNNLASQKSYELRTVHNQVGASGETLRYKQYVNDVPVYNASMAVHVSQNSEVTFHTGSFDNTISRINTVPTLTSDDAVTAAAKALAIEGTITQKDSELLVYNNEGTTQLVYRVTTNSKTLNGFWETIIDAHSGEVISKNDIAHYHHAHDDDHEKESTSRASMVEVTGKIFNPDPLSSTNQVYGGNFVDNDDQTNVYLDEARTDVSFLIANSENGLYTLKGEYLEIKEIQNPATGLFQQKSPVFSFTRDEDGFEAVNAYYHIDKNMRYINETLGIALKSMYNDGVILYDPHAFNGSDNSSYGGGVLKFGTGGVDDAEDADVIVHELGHGIHEWLIGGSISQVEGLSEGFGDYWAQSYSRGLESNNSSRSNASYNNLFKWDGHNEFWDGRVTDYQASYPEGLTGQIHKDGQIFSSTLMEVWELLGKETTDKIVLEGIAMTGSTSTQKEAMSAIRQAAIDMNLGCSNIEQVIAIINNRGYDVEGYVCSSKALAVEESEEIITNISIYPNPASDVISFKNVSSEHQISVYNMMGQKVLHQTITQTNNSVNVSNLTKGMYVVSFKGFATNFKFIKQ
ncbi:T9SS type A sorting domain-containing protein [Formosa sp. 3Alg 14/1]|uniref:T9SS type A sorting domain-containing protein n=1 Tax=Formosa sp. 3Alg 14/1 TaxID=3382190 RepID=UPI0039BEC653